VGPLPPVGDLDGGPVEHRDDAGVFHARRLVQRGHADLAIVTNTLLMSLYSANNIAVCGVWAA